MMPPPFSGNAEAVPGSRRHGSLFLACGFGSTAGLEVPEAGGKVSFGQILNSFISKPFGFCYPSERGDRCRRGRVPVSAASHRLPGGKFFKDAGNEQPGA
jgi:hypothetical protein